MGVKSKMAHDCNKGGPGRNCFNRRFRLKFDAFRGCFPGNISPTDIDLFVEINGAILMVEWKNGGSICGAGQMLAFTRFTKQSPGNMVIVVNGDAETMWVDSFIVIQHGIVGEKQWGSLDDLRSVISHWSNSHANQLKAQGG